MGALLKKITFPNRITAAHWFMISAVLVNIGNYAYNLILGRSVSPDIFADAALLITGLLALSFISMTFQLVVAKFTVLLSNHQLYAFIRNTYVVAFWLGVILGVVVYTFSDYLQFILQTHSKYIFQIFAVGTPIYLVVGVHRGVLQGKEKFIALALSYQFEMWIRLFVTFALFATTMGGTATPMSVSIGVVLSLFFSLAPRPYLPKRVEGSVAFDTKTKQALRLFVGVTLAYELTQILINNSDIFLVKHFFDPYRAGEYASLALIGRAVYFVTWMFIMVLLPNVVRLKKEGKPTKPVLYTYLTYILGLVSLIVVVSYAIPEFVVTILFGKSYIAIAPLLWKYALATSLFAVANLFAYYFLSIDQYMPILFSGLLGALQIILIYYYHHSLDEVVWMQCIAMGILLLIQLFYFNFSAHHNK